eukprot:jgi/Chlat1/6171/Chrsp41S05714
MDVFVRPAVEKILKETARNPKKHASLRQACLVFKDGTYIQPTTPVSTPDTGQASKQEQAAVPPLAPPETPRAREQRLSLGGSSPQVSSATQQSPGQPAPIRPLSSAEAGEVVAMLKLACESLVPKVMEAALDCAHKLLAHGFLRGIGHESDAVGRNLVTEVVFMVCRCADVPSDSVELQVIKVLLTAVVSNTFPVHGDNLLWAVRTCYNITLGSKNQVNKTTGKATLVQMLNIIFQRMESDGGSITVSPMLMGLMEEPRDATASSNGSSKEAPASTSGAGVEGAPDASTSSDNTSTAADQRPTSPITPAPAADTLSKLSAEVDSKGLDAALGQMEQGPSPGQSGGPSDREKVQSLSERQKDALLVFRSLCKLSMMDHGGGAGGSDGGGGGAGLGGGGTDAGLFLQGRLLALELLKMLVENSGPAFATGDVFVSTIKNYLCLSVLRNCVNITSPLFAHATAIFAVMVLRFRDILKAEIGAVFFPMIVLKALEDLGTPPTVQTTVVKAMLELCRDPQVLVDLFVNYDCDPDASNLFERLVTSLSHIAQASSESASIIVTQQQTALRMAALQCLVAVVRSLTQWTEKFGPPSASMGSAVALANASASARALAAASAAAASARASEPAASAAEATSGSPRAESQADRFDSAKAAKDQRRRALEAGTAVFNRGATEKGIAMLANAGVLRAGDPQSVADFLLKTPGLEKTAIGEYLGGHEDANIAGMHAYVASIPFAGLRFDEAIRKLLSGFRLPGEAQKIDRIMEKFAEQFCKDNPEVFKSADAAYTLAYSAIILNTDAHNPLITDRMNKADFVRMNSGEGGTDSEVPKEMLEDLYDRIVSEEIKMKDETEDSKQRGGNNNVNTLLTGVLNLALPRHRRTQSQAQESEAIVKRTRSLLRQHRNKQGMVFYSARLGEHARPMMEAAGWPVLAALSAALEDAMGGGGGGGGVDHAGEGTVMQQSSRAASTALCLEGFRLAANLACVLGLETLRDAFLTSLAKFTSLKSTRELRLRSIDAMKTLLTVAMSQGNALQDSWLTVIDCLSRIEQLQYNPEVPQALATQAAAQTVEAKERIFGHSVYLNSEAIVDLVSALCSVAGEELRQQPPQVFALQKLVEISTYNMQRIRMVWARIWVVVAELFIEVGCHASASVAMYAVDSLRQLAVKYLEHAELPNYTFQNDILKPFVVIIRRTPHATIRELVVQCVTQMVMSRVSSIRSGWKSVFMAFTIAAGDPERPVTSLAFTTVDHVVRTHFAHFAGLSFMDCVNCLNAFATSKSADAISITAITLLRVCAAYLADGTVLAHQRDMVASTQSTSSAPGGGVSPSALSSQDQSVLEYYWMPLLVGLSELTADERPSVRARALEALFEILTAHGHTFSTEFWGRVFNSILFSVFDCVRNVQVRDDDEGSTTPMRETLLQNVCIRCLPMLCQASAQWCCPFVLFLAISQALNLICACHQHQQLYSKYYTSVAFLLPQQLELLLACLRSPNQSLAATAVTEFGQLIDSLGPRLDPRGWMQVLGTVREAFQATMPVELSSVPSLPSSKSGNLPLSSSEGEIHAVEDPIAAMVAEAPAGEAEPEVGYSSSLVRDKADMMRSKCVVHLLLITMADVLHSRLRSHLSPDMHIHLFDTLQHSLDFSTALNNNVPLRLKLQEAGLSGPVPSLLRQEVEGTKVLARALLRVIITGDSDKIDSELVKAAEERLMNLCRRVLSAAIAAQSDSSPQQLLRRSLPFRAAAVSQACTSDSNVLGAFQQLPADTFQRHLATFYPLFTELICSEQLEIRHALSDLFDSQINPLLLSQNGVPT